MSSLSFSAQQGLQGRLEKLDLASAASDRCSEESYGVGGAIPSLASGAGGESDRKSIHALNGRGAGDDRLSKMSKLRERQSKVVQALRRRTTESSGQGDSPRTELARQMSGLSDVQLVAPRQAPVHDFPEEKLNCWLHLWRISLFALIGAIAHGWLYRPWKPMFLLLVPLGVAAFPAFVASTTSDHSDQLFFLIKAFSVSAFMMLMTALCVACAPDEAAWPFNGWVYGFCARHLRGSVWPHIVLYLLLSANILVAVLTDLSHQCYLNALTGFCLIASTPLPGAVLFQYPLEWIRKYEMGAMQAELQGLDVSDEELRARISDWYVVLMETKSRRFGDMCCRLPVSWVWLCTSWNALFMFDIRLLNDWTLAILLVPILESQRILWVLQSHGTALDPWMNSYWLQVRAFSLWSWLVLDRLLLKLLPEPAGPSEWFQLSEHDEDLACHFWGVFNLVWAILHLAWFWHRVYRLQAGTEESTEVAKAEGPQQAFGDLTARTLSRQDTTTSLDGNEPQAAPRIMTVNDMTRVLMEVRDSQEVLMTRVAEMHVDCKFSFGFGSQRPLPGPTFSLGCVAFWARLHQAQMMRRGIRSSLRALPRRDRWHMLQEYAVGESNQEEFRKLRVRDGQVTTLVDSTSSAAAKTIDWAAWDSRISNKEVLGCLKSFHEQQSVLLETVLKEDHSASIKKQTEGWELFDAAVTSCQKSVEKSEQILQNGARALWISFQNPPISMLSQSEWLDADQYWQAFVEKHHFYHNHLLSAVEDPESKDYDAKTKADLKKRWETFDGRGTTRQNNKLLYQRPSFEYYDVFRGPLIEHMIFYLTKTGGDARTFPEMMPTKWYAEIYDIRFKLYNVLQRRKRQVHEASWSREAFHDFHPHDLEHDGEAYYSKLIAKESVAAELCAGRLMGNFILFSDAYVPVQSGTGFYRAIQMDGGKGEAPWTSRHKPRHLGEVVGNTDQVRKLAEWLRDWDDVVLRGKKKELPPQDPTKKFQPAPENLNARAVLVSGPPGIGKTTTCCLVARCSRYSLMEFNASDARSKAVIDGLANSLAGNRTLRFGNAGSNLNRSVIIMDECDGMAGGDKGGCQALIKLIQATKNPVICICNDRSDAQVRQLATHCYDLRFRRPENVAVAKRIKSIVQSEGRKVEMATVEAIVEACGQDIRQVINHLQFFGTIMNGGRACQKDSQVMLSTFEACSRLLSPHREPLPLERRMDMYYVDSELMPIMVQENYLRAMDKKPAKMDELAVLERAAQASWLIATADGWSHNFELMNSAALVGTVYPSALMTSPDQAFAKPSFPAFLQKQGTINKNDRISQEFEREKAALKEFGVDLGKEPAACGLSCDKLCEADARPDRVDKDANLASPAAVCMATRSESGGCSDFLAVRLQTIPSVAKCESVETWDNPELYRCRAGYRIAYCTLNRPDANKRTLHFCKEVCRLSNKAMNDGIGGGIHDACRILAQRPDVRIAKGSVTGDSSTLIGAAGATYANAVEWAGGDPKSFQAAQAQARELLASALFFIAVPRILLPGHDEVQRDRADASVAAFALQGPPPGPAIALAGKMITEGNKLSAQGFARDMPFGSTGVRLLRLVSVQSRARPQFTICCMNGSAMGGGFGLVCACDYVIATKQAHATLSEVFEQRVDAVMGEKAEFNKIPWAVALDLQRISPVPG
ncbi:Gnf1 [Symbiodinium microadriaticum]|nr:Gnf1 [Symbiodinium microadriaticum]